MGNLKNKLTQFMYGRYGTDQLYIALIGAYFVLIVANTFISSTVISIFMPAVLVGLFSEHYLEMFTKDVWKTKSL